MELVDSLLMGYVRRRASVEEKSAGDTRIMTHHILLAILKAVEKPSLGRFRPEGEEDIAEEQKQIRYILNGCGITDYAACRKAIRGAAVFTDDEPRMMVPMAENHAEKCSRQHGYKVLRADAYIDALFSHPSQIISAGIPGIKETYQEFCRKEREKASYYRPKIGLLENISRESRRMEKKLMEEIRGQDHAIRALVDGISSSKMYSTGKGGTPAAFFVFAGPPGVGKTYLAEKAAIVMDRPFKRFDMSEYSLKEAADELTGYDSVYKEAKTGYLTSFVKDNPCCVLLFDEIEKAHIGVIHLFLQILDAGRLTDKYTKETVSFDNAYIIFTTNAGRSIYENDVWRKREVPKKVLLKALETEINPGTGEPFFPQAICSRMAAGYPIMFRQLNAHRLVEISKREFVVFANGFMEKFSLPVRMETVIPFYLLLRLGGDTDARTLCAETRFFFKNEILALGNYLQNRKLTEKLQEIESIEFVIDEGEELEKIFGSDFDGNDGRVVAVGDDAFVRRCGQVMGSSGSLVSTSNYHEAVAMVQENHVLYLLVQMPDLNSDVVSEGTTMQFDSVPISANVLSQFTLFLDSLQEKDPALSVYAVRRPGAQKDEELEKTLLSRGVAAMLSMDSIEEAKKFLDSAGEETRLQKVVDRFAKEQLVLDFDTAPLMRGNKIFIRLRNFRMKRAVSGEDTSSMVNDDRMPDVTFDSIIGSDEAKQELVNYIGFLKNPRAYQRSGLEAPKGILLYGPPGTGKTYLAKALAHESGVPFFPANGSEFVNKYTGSGPAAIRELFSRARKYSPSIIFIDEIDTIGRRRTGDDTSAVREETLNMLLSEMDGFGVDPNRPVFVMAATNFHVEETGGAKVLDPALIRRFGRRILVDLPNTGNRKEYLLRLLAEFDSDVSESTVQDIAKRSAGMNFSVLKNIMEQAARRSMEDDCPLDDEHLDDAFENEKFGAQKEWSDEFLLRTARHEAGHALMSCVIGKVPAYVTIVSRGSHGGYVEQGSDEEQPFMTKKDILGRIRVCLAGRASEILYYGKENGMSSSSSSDLEQATRLAASMICSYGMDEKSGIANFGKAGMTGETVRRINQILGEQADIILRDFTGMKDLLDKLVWALLEKNKLDSGEILEILGGDQCEEGR